MVVTGACCGLPLFSISVIFVRNNWADTSTRLLCWFTVIAMLASLGPRLHLAGIELFGLPWKLFQHLPLINNALPGRFVMYAFLPLAIVAALWQGSEAVTRDVKLVGVAPLAIFLVPNSSWRFWVAPVDLPAFFTDGKY